MSIKGYLQERAKIYCPNCGYKKVYWVGGNDDYTHYCKSCETHMTIKGFNIN